MLPQGAVDRDGVIVGVDTGFMGDSICRAGLHGFPCGGRTIQRVARSRAKPLLYDTEQITKFGSSERAVPQLTVATRAWPRQSPGPSASLW